jgi:hypothetical protein
MTNLLLEAFGFEVRIERDPSIRGYELTILRLPDVALTLVIGDKGEIRVQGTDPRTGAVETLAERRA